MDKSTMIRHQGRASSETEAWQRVMALLARVDVTTAVGIEATVDAFEEAVAYLRGRHDALMDEREAAEVAAGLRPPLPERGAPRGAWRWCGDHRTNMDLYPLGGGQRCAWITDDGWVAWVRGCRVGGTETGSAAARAAERALYEAGAFYEVSP